MMPGLKHGPYALVTEGRSVPDDSALAGGSSKCGIVRLILSLKLN